MKPEEVFKRYDIRGDYPEEIDEQFANLIGRAVGTLAVRDDNPRVVICQDNKESSSSLKQEVIEGVKSTGSTAMDAGVGPTDYAALAGRNQNAIAIQVTSSHLPLNANGFKLMYPEGNAFVNKDLDRVKTIFRKRDFESGHGEAKSISSTSEQKYKLEMRYFFKRHAGQIDKKVVLETMGGAASVFLPGLFDELGAELVELDEGHTGPYIDPPNPKPENLQHVEERVEETDADLGIATDMDADRVAVYHDGEWLSGNDLFAIFTELLKPEKVVASIDTSKKVEKAVESHGDIYYTRVGDPFVVEKMLDEYAELSGEPNGHYCFKDFVPYNSGSLSALLLAGSEIESLKQSIPEYHNRRASIEVDDKVKAMDSLKEEVQENYDILSEVDGVKFKADGATVLVRSSGSSEKLRIISDSESAEEAELILEEVKELID